MTRFLKISYIVNILLMGCGDDGAGGDGGDDGGACGDGAALRCNNAILSPKKSSLFAVEFILCKHRP